ncbi:hypothetical protein C3L33_20843, partial [Rhododendron williamsianum]
MGSLFAFFILFSLVLFGSTIDARPDSGEYWKGVMKDQPMPEVLHGLLPRGSVSPLSTAAKTDCHTSTEATNNDQIAKTYAEDFEPRPSATGYHDDTYPDDAGLKEKKSFVKDFEPRPNVSAYHDDAGLKGEKKSFVKDFEPRPNVSVYHSRCLEIIYF